MVRSLGFRAAAIFLLSMANSAYGESPTTTEAKSIVSRVFEQVSPFLEGGVDFTQTVCPALTYEQLDAILRAKEGFDGLERVDFAERMGGLHLPGNKAADFWV